MPDYDFNYHSGSGDTFIGATACGGSGAAHRSCLRSGPAGTAEDPVRDVAIRSQPRRHDSQQQRGLDERHVRHLPGRRVGVLLRDSQPPSDAGLQIHARWRALDAGPRSERHHQRRSFIRREYGPLPCRREPVPARIRQFPDRPYEARSGRRSPQHARRHPLRRHHHRIRHGRWLAGRRPVRRRHQNAGARSRWADSPDAHDEPARRLVADGQPSQGGPLRERTWFRFPSGRSPESRRTIRLLVRVDSPDARLGTVVLARAGAELPETGRL